MTWVLDTCVLLDLACNDKMFAESRLERGGKREQEAGSRKEGGGRSEEVRARREVAVADLKTVYYNVRREKMKRFLTGL